MGRDFHSPLQFPILQGTEILVRRDEMENPYLFILVFLFFAGILLIIVLFHKNIYKYNM